MFYVGMARSPTITVENSAEAFEDAYFTWSKKQLSQRTHTHIIVMACIANISRWSAASQDRTRLHTNSECSSCSAFDTIFKIRTSCSTLFSCLRVTHTHSFSYSAAFFLSSGLIYIQFASFTPLQCARAFHPQRFFARALYPSHWAPLRLFRVLVNFQLYFLK